MPNLSSTTDSQCHLNEGPFFQCCCKCIHLLQVINATTRKFESFGCAGFRYLGKITVPHPVHSVGCELYQARGQDESLSRRTTG